MINILLTLINFKKIINKTSIEYYNDNVYTYFFD